jgi:methylenetetrahydrofolate dehydrogenase (NADP+)/methenyltetrahydrofolate cyclohydrolase
MAATLLDGKRVAETVRAEVRAGVEAFRARHGRVPGLDVILVGDDAGSVSYTRNKEKAANEVGMRGRLHALPKDTSEAELLALVDALNTDPDVDAILVQLPLPKSIREDRVIEAIDPSKDVDGVHPRNVALLALGRPRLVPATPVGILRVVRESGLALEGARAVVVGRSQLVGRPVAELLLHANATVTVAHSRTRDLDAICREADVLVVAAGRPGLVRGDAIKPGAVVIDVGNTRVDAGEGKTKVVGDVAFDEAKERARAITPVPGGVGPMTIACLLQNALEAARLAVEDTPFG